MALYWDIEVTPEDEDEMIEKIAQKIHEHDLNLIAMFMIDTLKPLSFIGANMGRVFVSPLLPALGDNTRNSGVKLLQIFENKDNIDKLLNAVEKLDKEEKQRKKAEKAKNLEGKSQDTQKKWWNRIIP